MTEECPPWIPIEFAPKRGNGTIERYVRVLVINIEKPRLGVQLAYFDDDRYSKKPRPFWQIVSWRVTDSRANQPTHFISLPPHPKEKA
jgi:hypothetical protein